MYEVIADKIKNKKELTEEERESIAYGDGFEIVDEIDIEQRRWVISTETIFKLDDSDQLYSLSWERANTEMQIDTFPYDPVKVKKVEKITYKYILDKGE